MSSSQYYARYYPQILHKGAGTYIQIINMFDFLHFRNRAAHRCLAPTFFFSGKKNIFS